MNEQMEAKLRDACSDAADVFELVPETFCVGAYARIDDDDILEYASLGYVVTAGNRFCAVGAVSYLSGYTLHSAVQFIARALWEILPDEPWVDPECYNNTKDLKDVIRLLRLAAVRTDSTTTVPNE